MDWSERIGRRIRLRDLHILLAIVQCKSMAKAAEHLAVSKPVISKVIADLEHVLGVRLLERDRHGAEPTIYGAALLKRGSVVFDELREGVKDIGFLVDPEAGEVRIGCNPILASSFVSGVIERMARRYPRMVFHVLARQAVDLHRELSNRNVDLLVSRRLGKLADERLEFELLFEDTEVIAAGAQNPLVRRRKIDLADLMNESWVLPPADNVIGSVAMQALRGLGLDYPSAVVTCDSPHVRMGLVSSQRFLSIFPASGLSFPTTRSDIRALPVDLPLSRMPVGILTLKNRMLSPVARLFVKHAHELAKPLAKQE